MIILMSKLKHFIMWCILFKQVVESRYIRPKQVELIKNKSFESFIVFIIY